MGDRTSIQVTITSKPDSVTDEHLDTLIGSFGIFRDHPFMGDGTAYVDDETNLGTLGEYLAPALADLGVSFDGWEDPKYEWLGSRVVYTPDLGTFTHSCDAEGGLTFTAKEVRELLAASPDERARLMGEPWGIQ